MKKIRKIVLIVIIVLVAFFIIYKVDSRNRTKDRILKHATEFMNSVSELNYEKLKWYISDAKGNDLTDKEISNFLINSGLYRMQYLNNSANEKYYMYSTNVGFFNTNEGTIKIDVTALNGDVITNTFKYVNTGYDEHFVLKNNDIQKPTKEKATHIVATDLINGESVKWDEEEKETEKRTGKDTLDYIAFVKNSDGTTSFEILKETVQDYKLFLLNYINEEITDLKKITKIIILLGTLTLVNLIFI